MMIPDNVLEVGEIDLQSCPIRYFSVESQYLSAGALLAVGPNSVNKQEIIASRESNFM